MNAGEMPAGRELDALVAEHVMGVKWRWCYLPEPTRFLTTDDRYELAKGTERIGTHDVPSYSTDLAAAWPVFEQSAEA